MSLFLPEQKLGSHSSDASSSHKFMLKGRQTGGMHRGHGWIFRAESRDTMSAWYQDIKSLTEKTGAERTAYVRQHARSFSGNSRPSSMSSDGGMDEEDEADQVPWSGTASQVDKITPESKPLQRPQPGGRFPSDINVNNRHLHVPVSPSSGSSSEQDILAVAGLQTSSNLDGKNYATSGAPSQVHTGVSQQQHQPQATAPAMAQIRTLAKHQPTTSILSSLQETEPWYPVGTALDRSELFAPAAASSTAVFTLASTNDQAYRHHDNNSTINGISGPGQNPTTLPVGNAVHPVNSFHQPATSDFANMSPTLGAHCFAVTTSTGQSIAIDPPRPLSVHASRETIGTISDLPVPGGLPRSRWA